MGTGTNISHAFTYRKKRDVSESEKRSNAEKSPKNLNREMPRLTAPS